MEEPMSRTFKERGKHRKLVRNTSVQKVARKYANDFGVSIGDISKKIRSKLKKQYQKIKIAYNINISIIYLLYIKQIDKL